MSVDIKLFNELKVKNLSRVLEVTPETIVVAYKQWDLEQAKLGVLAAKAEEVAVQNKKELKAQLEQLEKQVAEIKAFLVL